MKQLMFKVDPQVDFVKDTRILYWFRKQVYRLLFKGFWKFNAPFKPFNIQSTFGGTYKVSHQFLKIGLEEIEKLKNDP